MGIKCLECNFVIKSNALVKKCPNCGNMDLRLFTRVEDKIDPEKYKKDKEWLESHRIIEIKTNPTEKEVDNDVDNSDIITVLEYKNENVINDFIDDSKRDGINIVFIHHYPREKKYTIGIKEL